MLAVQLGSISVMKFLIDAKADVNAANIYGVTALMAAKDDSEVIELLLKSGAKIETTDEEGATAACYASRTNQAKKLAALQKNGAKDSQCPN
jgi:ankyrin repeat protein